MNVRDVPLACCCGQRHRLATVVLDPLMDIVERLGPRIRVSTAQGAWLVPRVYIAAHGLRADEAAELAQRFHWERAL